VSIDESPESNRLWHDSNVLAEILANPKTSAADFAMGLSDASGRLARQQRLRRSFAKMGDMPSPMVRESPRAG
jgi:hypothetical protein